MTAAPRPLPPLAPMAAVMGLASLLAVALPLATYSTTLALFGTAHVLTELRFVEARFSARPGPRLVAAVAVLLAGVVGLRLAKLLDLWGGTPAVQLELVLVAALGGLVLPALARAGGWPLLVGVAVVGAVGLGLLTWPLQTMLVLAGLHNWTPVGFLAEALPAAARRRGLLLAGVAFLLLPALIATGLPGRTLAALGASWPEFRLLPTGPLAGHLGVYLPASWHAEAWALPLFSAVVFAQCMHYAAVIGVLPRLSPGGPKANGIVGLSRLPRAAFVLGVLLLTAVGLWGFGQDFAGTRRWYGLIAAVHAWVEVPVLLLALLPSPPRVGP